MDTHVYYMCAYIWLHTKSMKTSLSLKPRDASMQRQHMTLLVNSIPKQGFLCTQPCLRWGLDLLLRGYLHRRSGSHVFGGFVWFIWVSYLCFSFSNHVGRWTWSLKAEKENSSFKSTLQKNITSAVKNPVTIQVTVWGQPQFWHSQE